MRIFFVLAAISTCFIIGCNRDETPGDIKKSDSLTNPEFSSIQKKCTDYGELSFGDFLLWNNVWGKEDRSNYDQCIELKLNDTTCEMDWTWYWPDDKTGTVKAYPNIVYGWLPWYERFTNNDLPSRIADISDITITWDKLNSEFTGIGNFSFDIWITYGDPPFGTNITHEIMIWLKNVDMLPAGNFREKLTLDDVNYKLYEWDREWIYLAFDQISSRNTNEIKLGPFLNFLMENKLLSQNEFLSSICLGNEVIYGNGKTEVENYKIEIKKFH